MAIVFDDEQTANSATAAPSSGKIVFDDEPQASMPSENPTSPKDAFKQDVEGPGIQDATVGDLSMLQAAKAVPELVGSVPAAVKGVAGLFSKDEIPAAAAVIPKEAGAIPSAEPIPLRNSPEPLPQPASRVPPPPGQTPPATPPPKSGISDDIQNYINSKYQAAQAKPGLIPKIGNYLTEESNKLGSKDIGLRDGLIKTMGSDFKGIEKANQLIDYARDKGYFNAGLSDSERRTMIQQAMDKSGDLIGKMRQVADTRGAPDVDAIKSAVKTALDAKYGYGTEKATSEISNVMEDIDKAPKTFQGMANLATKLNKSATPIGKLGQHPGPTTDAADIVAQMGNAGARKTFSPQESELFTQNLRDFGANKKLEQTTAGSARREMGARSNQRGMLGRLWQEALDRGGYRMAGNIANRLGKSIQSGKVKTLPQFFEDLGHQSNEEIDNTINSMAQGGMVTPSMAQWVSAR